MGMERRLVTILAADVAGYSHLMELDEEAATSTLRAYFAVVEDAVARHRGRIFNTAGDSAVAEFHSVVAAIRCAVEIQHEITDHNAAVPENRRMQFRIGVNLGDVIAEENDLYGTGVNVAARIEQLAEPGGVCVSQPVYDQVRKIVEMSFQDIGEFRLKNIDDPVRVYRILSVPLPWFRRVLSRRRSRRRLAWAAGIALLILAAIVGSTYLAGPSALWTAVLGDGPSLPERPSITILPLDDLSPNGDEQYLADGITAELTTGLAKFPNILVVARNSRYSDEQKAEDVRQVAKQLNVRYVVEGSLQRSDQNVRVTAQLIDATTGLQVWAERYDRQLSNIFEIRDEITRNIAGTLMGTRGKIADAEIERLSAKDPNSFTAYDYAMRGWSEWYSFTPESNLAARNLFEQAIDIDPNYAYAYAGIAWTYSLEHDFGWAKDHDKALKDTLEMAEKAVRLDSNGYMGHWVLGWAYLYNRQHDKALASYKRARDLNPNDAELLAEMANTLIYVGQPNIAVQQLTDAIILNPFHETWYEEYLGWGYLEDGKPNEAIPNSRKGDRAKPVRGSGVGFVHTGGSLRRPQSG